MVDFAGASLRLATEGQDAILATLESVKQTAQKALDDTSRLTKRAIDEAAERFDALYGKQVSSTKQINDSLAGLQRLAKQLDVTNVRAVETFQLMTDREREFQRETGATVQQQARLDAIIRQVDASVARVAATEAREAEAAASAQEAMTMRYGRSLEAIARGGEMVARTGELTGRSLGSVINAASMIAFSFGAAGPIIGAIGITAASMFELFNRAERRAEQAKEKFLGDLEEIGRAGDVQRARELQSSLMSGDWFAQRRDGESDTDFTARRYGMAGLDALQQTLQRQITARNAQRSLGSGGSGGGGRDLVAEELANRLQSVKDKLAEMATQYQGVTDVAAQLQVRADAEAAANKQAADAKKEEKEHAKELLAIEKERAKEARNVYTYKEPTAQGIAEAIAGAFDGAHKENAFIGKAKESFNPLNGVQKQIEQTVTGLRATIGKDIADLSNSVVGDAEKMQVRLAAQFASSFTSVVTSGITAFVDALIASGGNLAKGFDALAKAAIAGLGKMVELWGEQALQAAIFAKLATENLFNPTGAGIAAALAMIALGAAMQAGASSSGHAASHSTYAAGAPVSITNTASVRPSMAAANGSSIAARPSIVFAPNIIGQNDPRAQRELLEMVEKGLARGTVGATRLGGRG